MTPPSAQQVLEAVLYAPRWQNRVEVLVASADARDRMIADLETAATGRRVKWERAGDTIRFPTIGAAIRVVVAGAPSCTLPKRSEPGAPGSSSGPGTPRTSSASSATRPCLRVRNPQSGTDTEATRAEAQAQGARFWSEALTARMIAAKDRAAALRLDCRECGACCCSVIPGKHIVVNMDFDEASRIEAVRPGATAHWRGQARAIVDDPKPWGSACQFLRGRPGACSCSIYYDRPQPCLVFPAGIEECLTMRKAVLPVVGVPLAKGERNGGVR